MIGEARAMGAISVVNAVASGRGATLAVRLPTIARVEVEEHKGGWRVELNGRRVRSSLAVVTAREALRMLGEDPRRYSGVVRTTTSVPVGVGLKTSSSASVAIALAMISAFGKVPYNTRDILHCSASSALEAEVSVTGAMDDAASCLLGGVNFADNSKGRVLSSERLGSSLPVLIKIPRRRSRRAAVRLSYVRRFSGQAESIFQIGRKGKVWKAMILNGFLYCTVYGYPLQDSFEALKGGAFGAGLSGTGPAVAAVFGDSGDLERLASRWAAEGAKLIRTETCDEGATVGL